MTFLEDVRAALAANGIRGALAERIVAELADHLACDPHARLGAPREIAERFAAELRVVRTRRATFAAFVALALCGLDVLLAGFGRHAAPDNPIAGLGVFMFSQVAFVAGMLALVRTLRGRTAGDFRLAQRRTLIALLAGAATCACIAVMTTPLALLPLVALVPAARASRRAAAVTPSAAAAGLRADVPVPLPVFGAIAVAFVLAQGIVGEQSVVEGLVRAATEATGLLLGVALLGRPLGLRD